MNIWEKMKKWVKEKKETLNLIGLVIFWLLILGAVCFVFFLLSLAFDNLQELKEVGGEKLIEWAFKIAGGVIAVIGLSALIWRSILMERQTEISQKQLKISQNIRYAEQFEKSVKNLENEDLGIFKVGLVSLNALSQEGKKEYREVWEQLCYFLRHHKPLQDKGEKPHPKVNAIAKILRERNTDYEDKDFKLDLTEVHLEEASLEGVTLSGANLSGANLYEASLVGASLEGATLSETNLVRAKLEGASLWYVSLVGANLEGADLSEAELDWANLEGALLGGIMASGEVQDLTRTRLASDQLWGTFYDETGPPPTLPNDISEKNKPEAISYNEWCLKDWGEL